MFKPIKLTRFDETLIDDSAFGNEEGSLLKNCVGIHAMCNGLMFVRRTLISHKAIFCLDCHLRIIIPAEIITYADLREHLSEDKTVNIQLVSAKSGN